MIRGCAYCTAEPRKLKPAARTNIGDTVRFNQLLRTTLMADTQPAVRVFLENSGIQFEVLDWGPSMADTHAFCEHYNIPFANSANAILVKAKKGDPNFTMCVLLATHRLDVNHAVRKKLDSGKVSFASGDDTIEQTGMELGGVTPVGLPRPLPIWVDADVMQCEYIILGGGNRETKLKVPPSMLEQLPTVEIVTGLANPIPTDTA